MENSNKQSGYKSKEGGGNIGPLNNKGQGNSSAGRENRQNDRAKSKVQRILGRINAGSVNGGSRFQILSDLVDESKDLSSFSRADKRLRDINSTPKGILKDCTNLHEDISTSKDVSEISIGHGSIGRRKQGSKQASESGSNICQNSTEATPKPSVKKFPPELTVMKPWNTSKEELPFDPPDGDTNMEVAASDGCVEANVDAIKQIDQQCKAMTCLSRKSAEYKL
ncbi:hypothetical protein ACOSQ4_006438 [Xanthoceras sorbifolium]